MYLKTSWQQNNTAWAGRACDVRPAPTQPSSLKLLLYVWYYDIMIFGLKTPWDWVYSVGSARIGHTCARSSALCTHVAGPFVIPAALDYFHSNDLWTSRRLQATNVRICRAFIRALLTNSLTSTSQAVLDSLALCRHNLLGRVKARQKGMLRCSYSPVQPWYACKTRSWRTVWNVVRVKPT